MESRFKRKKRKPWKWALYGGLLSLAMVIGFALFQGIGLYNALDKLQADEDSRFSEFKDNDLLKNPPKWEGKERVNILLLGGDGRESGSNGIARSDSILIVSIDPLTKKAHLFSVLRDTYVDIPGHGKQRVNTAVVLGGPDLAMETVGNLLGLPIHYYVYAEFEGFKALIDEIGGVDFEVEKDMDYVDNADGNRYDIHLKKGMQHLNGDEALQYVRFRHDAMSDFTRTERQRNFMKAVALKMQTTWNLIRMKEIIESVQPYIETNLSVQDMLKLGQLGLGLHMAGSAQVPPMNLISDTSASGASVLAIRDNAELLEYIQDVLSKDETLPADQEGSADPGSEGAGESGIGGTD